MRDLPVATLSTVMSVAVLAVFFICLLCEVSMSDLQSMCEVIMTIGVTVFAVFLVCLVCVLGFNMREDGETLNHENEEPDLG